MTGGFGSCQGREEEVAPATREIKADQGGSTEDENPEVAVAVVTTAAHEDDDESAPAPATEAGDGMVKMRLSDEEIQYVLCWERREFAPDTSDMLMSEEEVVILRRAVEAFKVLNDNFAEYQAEVRQEYEARGYVEVDDDFVERREEKRQWMRENLADSYGSPSLDDDEQEEEDGYDNEKQEEEDGGHDNEMSKSKEKEEDSYGSLDEQEEEDGYGNDEQEEEDGHDNESKSKNVSTSVTRHQQTAEEARPEEQVKSTRLVRPNSKFAGTEWAGPVSRLRA